jgi:hypothetical protein
VAVNKTIVSLSQILGPKLSALYESHVQPLLFSQLTIGSYCPNVCTLRDSLESHLAVRYSFLHVDTHIVVSCSSEV